MLNLTEEKFCYFIDTQASNMNNLASQIPLGIFCPMLLNSI